MEKPGQLASTERPPSNEERSQWELEKRIFHLKTLYDVSQVIGSLRDLQGVIQDLVMMVMGTFGALRGIILLADMQKNQLEAVASRGLNKSSQDLLPQIFKPKTFQEMNGIDAIQLLAAEPQVSKGGRKSLFSLLSSLQLRIWVPFVVNERFKGGIGLGEKLSGEVYSADDQELLSTLANQLTIALDNVLAYKEIEQLNRGLEEKVRQRTEELRLQHERLKEVNSQLELRNRFIQSAFGRYVSDEVVASLLENPEGLILGGEKRKTTILMSDLRGFTPLTERLAPEQVLTIVNRYLGAMVDVILHYQGTINEFIGDAILVLFGAPIARDDDARRAVACAVAMQQAMAAVNAQNTREGLPEVEMGIGVHTGEVVVGNIGSHRRMKYGVVGSPANLTSRVESYTVGGQILISEATRQEVGPILTIAQQMEVEAKGIGKPLVLYDVRGIAGEHTLFLPDREEEFLPLSQEIPLRYTVVEGKHLSRMVFEGRFVTLSVRGGEIHSDHSVPPLSNIKIQLINLKGEELPGDFYGKVVAHLGENRSGFAVRFTSLPPETLIFKLLRSG